MPFVNERHPEWRDQNGTSKYPFSDRATLTNDNDVFLPETVLLDAALYPIGATARLYLSSVSVDAENATLTVGDELQTVVASVTFDLTQPPDLLKLVDNFGRPAGVFVSEATRLSTFQGWEGVNEFTIAQTEFVARVCMPVPAIGFRGFVLDDGSVFTDDIWLVGDGGVVLRREAVAVPSPGYTDESVVREVIRVDIVGDPLFRRRLCGSLFVTPRFLKTITVRNGCEEIVCGPDSAGDFKLTAGTQDAEDSVLRIRSVDGRLFFEAVGERLENL